MKNPFLVGARVYLRPMEREDARTLQPWINAAEIRRFTMGFKPMDLQGEVDHIEKLRLDPQVIVFVIALTADDEPIGMTGLHQIDFKNRRAEFGIAIGNTSMQGQGLGTEATQLVVDFAFGTLNLNRVSLFVFDYNERARRCYEKVGFVREGVLREDHYADGKYWDAILMSMLRRDWDARRSQG